MVPFSPVIILEGSWSLLSLLVTEFSYSRLPSLWSWLDLLRWNFGAPFWESHGPCWACQWRNQVCGLDWACWNETLELHFERLIVLAGPASDRIFVLQIVWFVVLTRPAADEILELHFLGLMVFAGPASDRIFVLQIAQFVVLTEPAANEILELHSARFMVMLDLPVTYIVPKCQTCGLDWAWHRHILELYFVRLMVLSEPATGTIGLPGCDSSGPCWACRCHGRNVLLVFELSCAQ